ncbi:MAG: hypothetical protein LBL52_01695 [Rickettsiales bacterium]|jgi:exopolyphosphatase/pppGpp-phosphohydrolase|nr:hypothetical protein [Rickettsiales bacterium]
MKYYIDIGSSTVKTYRYDDGKLDLVDENSLHMKLGFTPGTGLSDDRLASLFSHFERIKAEFGLSRDNTSTYATGVFRDIPEEQKVWIQQKFVDELGLDFNIISHEQEGYYLKKATELDYGAKKVMIVNMGGKTTEIVTVARDSSTQTQLINLGAADLTAAFLPRVNEPYSGASIEEMEAFVANAIREVEFDRDYDFALFTGELRAERLVGYPMEKNTMFADANHPFQESLEDFIEGTRRMFFDMKYEELEQLTPHNPKWWVGGRAGAVLPLAIFRKADIKVIVPSDLNLINGVINDENNK